MEFIIDRLARSAIENRKSKIRNSIVLLLVLGILAACAPAPASPAPVVLPSSSPRLPEVPTPRDTPPTPTPTPAPPATPTSTPTPGPLRLVPDDGLPPSAVDAAIRLLAEAGVEVALATDRPDLRLSTAALPGGQLIYERILVPAVRFPSLLEGITLDEVRGVWSGSAPSGYFAVIYVGPDVLADLETLLGPPGPAVQMREADKLADALWGDPKGIAIVPFEALSPRVRAVRLGDLSAVDNRLDQADWPLAVRAWLSGQTDRGRAAHAKVAERPAVRNRDPNQLTVVVMTGVTAMARSSAVAIEQAKDHAFLARVVGPELAAADITVISNEIPFVEGCVPDNTRNNLLLCSKPEYFAALALSGVDAVGLTGNHQNDFGYDAMLASLDFYAKQKIPVYAGGANDEAARAPLLLEHHGNRLAFLGANQFGPESYWSRQGQQVSAWAGADTPGSARFDRAQMAAAIQALKQQGHLVFAEVQHTEFNSAGNYQVEPLPGQMADFQALSDAGAAVVTGVQAHTPQAVELRGDGIILYGLGNLYFDQTWSWPTRTGLVARHALYANRLLNTELLVTVLELNMQPRWATPEERSEVLGTVFAASEW